jgi:transcriptional antiterminator NusG
MAEFDVVQPEDVDPSEEEIQDKEDLPSEEASNLADKTEANEDDPVEAEAQPNKDREDVELAMEKILESSTDSDDEAVVTETEEERVEEKVDLEEEGEEEPSTEVELDEEPDDGRRWYVVHCYSGYENKVRHNLEQRIETMGMKDRIFDVVVPTEEEIEVKEGKRRTIERRVFPGYILVQMIMTEESWYVVRNTPGVTGFVGMGNEPTPLRPEEVASIIKRMEAEAPRIKVTYKIGQKVRIIDGPFNDFIGTVDDIDMERAKVRVMVSFFGRETPVELDFLQVEKA